jgi:PAS domain S-box-containing protein/diguanylate cyclase (GGDEF)-like protein
MSDTSDPFYQLLFESSPQACWIFSPKTLAFRAVNEAAVETYGFSREEFLRSSLEAVHPPSDRTLLIADVSRYLTSSLGPGLHPVGVQRHRTRVGSPLDVEVSWGRLDWEGEPAILAVLNDVTARTLAERVLWEREAHFREVVTAAPVVLWAVDVQGVLTLSEGSGLLAIGGKPGDLVGKSVFQAYKGQDALLDLVRRSLRGETLSAQIEIAGRTFDAHFAPLRGPGGEVEGATGAAVDVTARQRAEQDLASERDFLKVVLDTNPHLVFAKDRTGRFTLANARVAEAYGTTPEGLLGKTDADFNAVAAQVEAFRRDDLEVMDGRKEKRIQEELLTDATGRNRWLQTVKRPIVSRDGSVQQVLGVATDITELKTAYSIQSALFRISERASAQDAMQDLFREIHGIVAEILPAKNFYIALLEGHDTLAFPYFVDEHDKNPGRKRLTNGLTEYVLRTGKPVLASPDFFEALVKKGEADLIGAPSLDWLGAPLKSASTTIGVVAVQSYSGDVRYTEGDRDLLGFVADHIAIAIERRRAQEDLRESERRARDLVDHSLGLVCTHDLEGRILSANAALAEILGYSIPFLVGKSLGDFIPERFRGEFPTYLAAIARQGRDEGLLRVVTRSGEERVWAYRNILRTDGGEPPHILGHALDVTERLRLERQVREREVRDPLTGCYSRRWMPSFETQAGDASWGLIRVDLDKFSSFSEKEGQRAGEEVLIRMGLFLTRNVRALEAVVRRGRGEFVVLLPGADEASCGTVASRIETVGKKTAPFPFSMGWAARKDQEGLAETLARAEAEARQVEASPPPLRRQN